jgi:hypothetical protein
VGRVRTACDCASAVSGDDERTRLRHRVLASRACGVRYASSTNVDSQDSIDVTPVVIFLEQVLSQCFVQY